MTSHAAHYFESVAAAVRREGLWRFGIDRFLTLPLGAAIALIWANTAGESYFRVAHALAFPVNEIGMAFFLGLLMQEALEATMPGGALQTWRRWILPIVAGVGGVAGAALTYQLWIAIKHEAVLASAWPVAAAVDVVAGYYVLRLIRPRHGAIPFLLLLAIATNAIALTLVAAWPPDTTPRIEGIALLVAAMSLAETLRRLGERAFWRYFVSAGTLSWFGLYLLGVHPALALLPVVPFLPREPRPHAPFADPPDDDAVHHAEHEWNYGVQGVLFLFGLVNGGMLLTAYDTGTWGVLLAAFVGRPAGILATVAIALVLGLHLPRQLRWRDLVVVALATSTGFTFALFVASGILPIGGVLEQIKAGALATTAGAVLAVGVARLLRVGRFGR
jgi:Na+:H+ antiporter, NhaA family